MRDRGASIPSNSGPRGTGIQGRRGPAVAKLSSSWAVLPVYCWGSLWFQPKDLPTGFTCRLASNWTACLAACRNCVLVWEMRVLCCFPFSLPMQQCAHHLTFLYSALISIKMKIKHTLRKNLSVKLIHIDCNLTHCKIFQARPGRQHVINLVCKFKPVSNSCYRIWIRQWQS